MENIIGVLEICQLEKKKKNFSKVNHSLHPQKKVITPSKSINK